VASAITHALVGAAIGFVATSFAFRAGPPAGDELELESNRARSRALRRWFPLLTAFAAVLPDLDVVMHAWVKYSHPFGHRGAFHSLGFYLVMALCCSAAPWFRSNRAAAALALFSAMLSHSLLDMLTNGGLGIAILWPITGKRWFFPWRPIPVSPLSIGAFFSWWGVRVLYVELQFALPLLAGALLVKSVVEQAKREA
jgi:inner membrane protein